MSLHQERGESADLEIAIVGAGFAGLHMLHRALKRGRKVRLFEAGKGVGGTWYWNRYPGARVDIESLEYSYSFSEELQQEWEWSERYSPQAELLRYANHVADRFGLRPHIQLDATIVEAAFDEERRFWRLTTQKGERVTVRFCVLATGLLYKSKKIDIPGLESFRGQVHYTSQFPEGADLRGKRVVVIGTGSSGVQTIAEVAKVAAELTVLQRTPSWVIPAHNRPLDPELVRTVKSKYGALRETQLETLAGFLPLSFMDSPHPTQNAMDVSPEERKAVYDARWAAGGLSFYTAFKDLLVDPEANRTCADYVREKIRGIVNDPRTAEKLCPKYPILARRLCAGIDYYETYNRPNVHLVDINEEPIEGATPEGLRVGGRVVPCDVVICATGFDALTGSITEIDLRGRGGRTIREHWSDGAPNYLGLMCAGFPNLVMMNGPGSPSAFWAPIQIAQLQAEWIERCMDFMAEKGIGTIEASPESETTWMDHVQELAAPTLLTKVRSWYQGDNIPGKRHQMLIYLGGYHRYREVCDRAAEDGYAGFALDGAAATAIA